MQDSDDMFKIRVNNGQFVSVNNKTGGLVAVETSPGQAGIFQILRNAGQVRIKAAPNGKFLQVKSGGVVTADRDVAGSWSDNDPSIFVMSITEQMQGDAQLCSFYGAETAVSILQSGGVVTADRDAVGSWSDNDPSVFVMSITEQMQGDAQLCSFYGAETAVSILQDHWNKFITKDDFRFISSNGLNAVRIPVAWWITKRNDTPSCHPPNYPGYQAVLDNAFDWAEEYNLGVIVDLHAAPWSQNGQSHSASRDGTVGWGEKNIDDTVKVIQDLAARYASRKSLLAIELLNEPSEHYYQAAYTAVRNQVKRHDVYVIMEGRLAHDGDSEMADFASQFQNFVLDVHFYNLYAPMFNSSMSAEQNIHYVTTTRANHLKSLMRADGPLVFVGEWTAKWNVTSASRDEYQNFVNAQMDVYGQATFGWAFWSYKTRNDPYWSLENLIKDGKITVPQN